MNKITTTLAGLALAAGVGVAPAFAQGNLFSPPGSFTFSGTSSFTATGTGETFNPMASGAAPITPVSFTLLGTAVSGFPGFFDLTSLTINGANVGGAGINTFKETGPLGFSVANSPSGFTIASTGAAADGTTFNLVGGTPAAPGPVPEASTTASFGLLLALGLGGLTIAAKRKKAASAL